MMTPIHPFPARMAPELARASFLSLPAGSRILDPMCGSGTSLRYAVDAGHKAVGWDIDPLSVKMARTWCRRYDVKRLKEQKNILYQKIKRQRIYPPSRFVGCPETQKFVQYWFAKEQSDDLNRLSIAIESLFPPGRTRDFFQIALSRTVITKFRGASLAWDISHSRPHKKKTSNDFQTIPEFFKSVEKLIQFIMVTPCQYDASVQLRDCRRAMSSEEFDLIITSPPYLNAIDYMRGHKFSLIWMGYTIPELRQIRGASVGVERGSKEHLDNEIYQSIIKRSCNGNGLNQRVRNYLFRYIYDCETLIRRMKSVLTTNGTFVVVVGNSTQRGTKILNDRIFTIIAEGLGFKIREKKKRLIPRRSRYLPISPGRHQNQILNRMKTESVIYFVNA